MSKDNSRYLQNNDKPQAFEAERSTLGAMLTDQNVIVHATEALREEDFYREIHRYIFNVIMTLFSNNDPVDLTTVTEELRRRDQLGDIGGAAYVTALMEACPSTAKIESYCKEVHAKSILRQLLSASEQISNMVYDEAENGDTTQLISRAKKKFFEVGAHEMDGELSNITTPLMSIYDQIERTFQSENHISGTSTGFIDLDDITCGLQSSELIIIAARPKMGKTSLCLNIAHHVALRERLPVAIFSQEVPKEKLVRQLICSEAQVKSKNLDRGLLNDSDWMKVTQAVNNLYQAPIFIDDASDLSTLDMMSKARRLTTEHGQLGLIVVDYLQKISSSNDSEEISANVRDLKTMARKLRVPVIVLSQLPRTVEQREDKRPLLSDLRELGSIEADTVAFIYRPSYYKQNGEHNDEKDLDVNIAEIIIAKQRNGPVGTIRLSFLSEFGRFANLASDSYDPYS